MCGDERGPSTMMECGHVEVKAWSILIGSCDETDL